MKDEYKYIKPKSINKILERLRGENLELLVHKIDRGFWYDEQKNWANKKTKYTNRSTEPLDMEQNTKDDITKVATELLQISLFGRILTTNDEDEINNLPKLHLPYFYKQTIGSKEKDLYDINSQKALMRIDEKNKNLNMVRKSISHYRQKNKRKSNRSS